MLVDRLALSVATVALVSADSTDPPGHWDRVRHRVTVHAVTLGVASALTILAMRDRFEMSWVAAGSVRAAIAETTDRRVVAGVIGLEIAGHQPDCELVSQAVGLPSSSAVM